MPQNKLIEFSIVESAVDATASRQTPAHHVGSPPTSFINPWPSFQKLGFGDLFSARFTRTADRNHVPVPADRKDLVRVRKPDWAIDAPEKLRATWLGHASFFVETQATTAQRGIRILFDPVFSKRTSPVQFLGPKRYNPPPCTIEELPEVDVIAISHNHYDHLDTWTI